MTREEWDAKWLVAFNHFYEHGRSFERASSRAWTETKLKFGPRPEGTQGLPLGYRIGVELLLSKLRGIAAKELNPMSQRIVNAAIYTVVAVMAAFQATGMPQTPEAWAGLAVLAVTTFWGKFSTSTRLVAANRVGE
jgi:hypothetical protein